MIQIMRCRLASARLSPGQRQAIIWTNAGILLVGHLGTNFSEILIKIHTFPFKKMHLKMSAAKCRPFCLGFNVLIAKKLQQLGWFHTHSVSVFLFHVYPWFGQTRFYITHLITSWLQVSVVYQRSFYKYTHNCETNNKCCMNTALRHNFLP